MSTRRKRTDSAAYAVEASQAALTDLEPPEFIELREEDMPFWYAITRTRHRRSWTESDLLLAASLARIQCDIERHARLLEDEDDIDILPSTGKRVPNPRIKILNDYRQQAMALCRTLQVHALATQGDSDKQQKSNQVEREARNNLADLEGDDFYSSLIARPTH